MRSMKESYGFVAADEDDKDAISAAWITTGIFGVARGNGVTEFRFNDGEQRVNVTADNVAGLGIAKLLAISEEFGDRIDPPVTQDLIDECLNAKNLQA